MDPSKQKRLHKTLLGLERQLTRAADSVAFKAAAKTAKHYKPYLRIIVEPADAPIVLDYQGPFVYDLSTRPVPMKDFQKISWRTLVEPDADITSFRAVKPFVDDAIRRAKKKLAIIYYQSTILDKASTDPDVVINANYQHLLQITKATIRELEHKQDSFKKDMKRKVKENKKKIRKLKSQYAELGAKRSLRRIKNKTLTKESLQMKHLRVRVRELEKENRRIEKSVKGLKAFFIKKRDAMLDQAFLRACRAKRKKIYRPLRKDLFINATVLLLP